jgi:hypothetical protein
MILIPGIEMPFLCKDLTEAADAGGFDIKLFLEFIFDITLFVSDFPVGLSLIIIYS